MEFLMRPAPDPLIVVPSMMKLVFVLHDAFPWIVQW
jgi:hypothetical protein